MSEMETPRLVGEEEVNNERVGLSTVFVTSTLCELPLL